MDKRCNASGSARLGSARLASRAPERGSGPSTANASGPLAFYGTVVRGGERHTIWYRAAGAAVQVPTFVSGLSGDAGDAGVDASIDPGPPPVPACEPVPSWYPNRPNATACADRPPGDPNPRDGDECTSDTECTTGMNGRCLLVAFVSGPAHRKCTYDACVRDSDCTSGVCSCSAFGNLCLTNSNCRVDGDCASGRCVRSNPYPTDPDAPLEGDELYGPPTINRDHTEALGYFCTTPNDNCCSLGSGYCTYDWDKKQWDWGYGP